MRQYRRLVSIAAAVVAGLAGVLVVASPASAHAVNVSTSNHCLADGTRKVTWTVDNSEIDKIATITSVSLEPAGSTVTNIVVGAEIPKGGVITGTQILPGDATSAHLEVWAQWTDPDGAIKTNSAEHSALWEGTCSPQYTVKQECTAITFAFPAVPDGDEFSKEPVDVSLTPSAGDSQAFQLKGGDPEKTVTFTGSAGLTVDLSYGRDFKKSYPWAPDGCPAPDLPTTGSSLTGALAIGGGLLLVGIVLVAGTFVFRRRRGTPGGGS